jgi:hypothetical protein
MFGKIIDSVRARWALWTLEKNPLYQLAVGEICKTLTDETKGLGKYASQKFKQELAGNILKEVTEVILAGNQVQANREKLTNAVLQMAKYQVLVLPAPSESEEDTTSLRGQPGITGELKAHIKLIAEKDKEIKELAWSLDNPTEQDIYEACLFQCWVTNLYANVFHMLRMHLKDHPPNLEKDWFRPFVAAICAWEEHNYRKLIELPDALSKDGRSGELEALKYSTFMNMVLDGSKYPNFEWQEAYKTQSVDA